MMGELVGLPADVLVELRADRAAVAGSRVVTMPGIGHEAVTTGPDVLVTVLTGVAA
jgi:hypothetical protein